jgi:uncharacterized membrane protein YjfL (UPF0719 family)
MQTIEISFWVLAGWWILRMVVVASICSFLGLLGIRVLDALTPKIHKRELIGKDPIATGIFLAGFIIFIGLVIHGVSTMPFSPAIKLITLRRLGLIALSFFASIIFGIAIFNLMDRATPKIPFRSIEENPIAVAVYVFGYLVFFGLILHASLTMSL